MTAPTLTLGGSIDNASVVLPSASLGTSANPIDIDTLTELGDEGNPIMLY
jgi:hypothetical protein